MANPSQERFDADLKELRHYRAFSVMLPYVGSDYAAGTHRKLLVLGESFYFPEYSTTHLDASRWYGSNQTELNSEEMAYINCRQLLECDWGSPGHKIYRELNACIGTLGLPHSDRPISNIAFTNTFMRPATETGGSFTKCCTTVDGEMSKETISGVVRILEPDLVIFASRFASNVLGGWLASNSPRTKVEFVSHPADPFHWNKGGYQHGRKKLLQLLSEGFLRTEA
jgi:hypothetical protein